MAPPERSDDWIGVLAEPLPLAEAYEWAVTPDSGAVVVFSGTVRDHAEGRTGVVALEYEAYAEAVGPALTAVATETRRRHPATRRLAILHRTGRLGLGESSVLVVASSAHRGDAFSAARFAIDALKESVPIWKKETWRDGSDWGTGARPLVSPAESGAQGAAQ